MADLPLDIDALLAPIDDDNPAGTNLREDASPDSPYYALKDARSIARSRERSMDDSEEGVLLPEWRTILDTAPGVLAERSKDLEVASWLTEALIRADGFGGLAGGFRLIAGLVDGFWESLYPPEDEDGVETKVAPVTGLNGEGGDGTLIAPIRRVPISLGNSAGPFATWQFDQAMELRRIDDEERRQARIDAGAVAYEDFERAVRETPADFYIALDADLEAAQTALAAMSDALDAKAGHDAPPLGTIRDALTAVRDAVGFIMREWGKAPDAPLEPAETAAPAEAAVAAGASSAPAPAGATGVGPIASREDAFQAMLRIAEFFRKTEPHSPVSYTLEELVRRGRMPLTDLIGELIPDDDARRNFLLRAGIAPPQQEDGY